MSTTRERIRRHVQETPGIHQSRLGRELDLAAGQLQYHLHRLRKDGAVTRERVSGKTHYFPSGFDPWERRATAFLRRETARGIILRLHADGPATSADLAAELDLARSTISWHVSKLVSHDIVEKSATTPMELSLRKPDRTAELLDVVSPSLPERIVDRFIRTVDQLLE